MHSYNLGFISDTDIYNHVRETVLQYRRSIDLKEFNKNLIDPIKLTFDSKIYGQGVRQTIESECIRQIDKTNNNRIGYFHQYMFKYAGNGWEVPANGEKGGFDVINEKQYIYSVLLNKPNKISTKRKVSLLIKFFDRLLKSKDAVCYVVDMGDYRNKDEKWNTVVNGKEYTNERLRIVSLDRFYDIVFNQQGTYWRLNQALPKILNDIN